MSSHFIFPYQQLINGRQRALTCDFVLVLFVVFAPNIAHLVGSSVHLDLLITDKLPILHSAS